jgi:hypothetical protein
MYNSRHEAAVDDVVSNANSGSPGTPVAEGDSRLVITLYVAVLSNYLKDFTKTVSATFQVKSVVA